MIKYLLMCFLVVGSVFQACAIDDEEFVNMTAVRQKFSLGEKDELTPEALTFATAVRDRMRINRAILQDIDNNPQQVHENMDCSYARFSKVMFLGATFRRANFSHCFFNKSTLFLSEFISSNCQQITFFKCTILGGGFERSDLTRGHFNTVDFGSEKARSDATVRALAWVIEKPALLRNPQVQKLLENPQVQELFAELKAFLMRPDLQPNTQENPKGPPAV